MSPEEYKAIRENLALTQGGLAARLGVTRKTVNASETGAPFTLEITQDAPAAFHATAETKI